MSQVIEAPVTEHATGPAEPRPRTHGSLRQRLSSAGTWLAGRRRSIAWFLPVYLVSIAVQAINLGGSPQRIDDEGTYVAQAWAIENLGQLTHYTYWYDHPPLGWMQIAVWTSLTGAFDRYDVAVLAGREAMLVTHLVGLTLLWLLARRLGFARPTAAAALAIYAFSPLAVQFHRTVFLDNVAVPWLLAAFVLVLAPRRQLAAFAAAAVCFAIAVLSKETFLLFLPFLAWLLWRNAHRDTRRYTVSVAAAIVVLLGSAYVLLAVIKGELVPGTDRVSLFSGLAFQLGGRESSGSLFTAGTQAQVTLGQWLQLDPVLAVVAPLAAVAALWDRRVRPVAAALVFLVLFMLRPGYLPIPYVIGLLPFAALVIAGTVQQIAGHASVRRRAVRVTAGALVALTLVGVAAPQWGPQLRGLLLADLDQPMRQAEAWVEDNVSTSYRLVVDDSMWVDLVEHGFPRENVTWYYKVDTDPAVAALAPEGWRDYDFVISTNSMRTFPEGFPIVRQALNNSVVVARFGTGDKTVEVNRVLREGREATTQRAAVEQAARTAAGADLVRNPNLDLVPGVRDLVTGGRLDARALVVLPRVATLGRLTVADLPALPGEESTDRPRRQVLVTGLDGRGLTPADVAAITAVVTEQSARYAALRVQATDQGALLTWDTEPPAGLLPAAGQ